MGERKKKKKQVQKNLIRTSCSRLPEKRLKVPEWNKAEIRLVIRGSSGCSKFIHLPGICLKRLKRRLLVPVTAEFYILSCLDRWRPWGTTMHTRGVLLHCGCADEWKFVFWLLNDTGWKRAVAVEAYLKLRTESTQPPSAACKLSQKSAMSCKYSLIAVTTT